MTTEAFQLEEPPVAPKTFHQLGILVLDGSGSMAGQSRDKCTKAESVNLAVRELLGRLQASIHRRNFSIAVVTFDTLAKTHTPLTPVEAIDSFADFNPLPEHGGGTSIGPALQEAQRIAEQFLSQPDAQERPTSVVLILMSDGCAGDQPGSIADAIKQNPKMSICTTHFAGLGENETEQQASQKLLRELASSPSMYRTAYDAEGLRKFFIASVSAGRNVRVE